MKRNLALIAAFCGVTFLAGCGAFGDDDKKPLEGQRISLFDLEKSMSGSKDAAPNAVSATGPDTALELPKAWANEFWPQSGGYANHAMGHVALSEGNLKKIWSSSIGSGASKEQPLSGQPIIADGRIFTLDTKARVRAFDAANGKDIWTSSAMPEKEDDPVIGGGIAFSGGRLFVTAGFNEVLAFNPGDGSLLWRVKVDGAVRSAPSAMPERVYVVSVDNETFALDAATGKQIWTHQGLAETTGLLGAASPAANRDIVLPAYSSGEVYALQAETGSVLWSDTIAPMARAGTGANFSDIRGLPVIDRGLVIAISYGGRIAAIDERTGERRWEAAIAGAQTPFVSGNRVFLVSSDSAVISLDIATGKTLWSTQLPKYKDPEDLKGPIVWYGPILGGGRLMLFSSTGLARELNPQTGQVSREWETDQDVVAPPSVANGSLFLLSAGGTLSAWK